MSYYSGAIASKSLISSFTGVKGYLFSRLYFTYAHIGSSKIFSINNAHNGLSRLDYWISWSIHPWANRWIKVPSYGLCIKLVDGFLWLRMFIDSPSSNSVPIKLLVLSAVISSMTSSGYETVKGKHNRFWCYVCSYFQVNSSHYMAQKEYSTWTPGVFISFYFDGGKINQCQLMWKGICVNVVFPLKYLLSMIH